MAPSGYHPGAPSHVDVDVVVRRGEAVPLTAIIDIAPGA
jgi:hypothetical protein